MSTGDAQELRKALRERDARIAELEEATDAADDKVHEYQRKLQSAEQTVQRQKISIANLEAKVKKAQEDRTTALKKVAEVSGNRSFASAASAAPTSPQPPRSQQAGGQAGGAAGNSSVLAAEHSLLARTNSGAGVAADAMDIAALRGLVETEREETLMWQRSAQVVLQSYKTRMLIERQEAEAFTEIVLTQRDHMLDAYLAYRARAEQLQRAATQQSRLSETEDARRVEQFRELTSLREHALVSDRERAVLERELSKADGQVADLEEALRRVQRENRDLHDTTNKHQREASQLSQKLADASTASDMAKDASKIAPHSQLQGEVIALTAQLADVTAQRDRAVEKGKAMKTRFREMQAELSVLYSQGQKARDAMLSELSAVGGASAQASTMMMGSPQHGTAAHHQAAPTAAVPTELMGQQQRLASRVHELEAQLTHRNHALAVAEQRLQQSVLDASHYSPARSATGHTAPNDPTTVGSAHASYARGMFVSDAAPAHAQRPSVSSGRPSPAPSRPGQLTQSGAKAHVLRSTTSPRPGRPAFKPM